MKLKDNLVGLTEWFKPKVKPAYVGVYEIGLNVVNSRWYSYWDGSRWCYTCMNVKDAFDCKHMKTKLPQNQRWRGLSDKP